MDHQTKQQVLNAANHATTFEELKAVVIKLVNTQTVIDLKLADSVYKTSLQNIPQLKLECHPSLADWGNLKDYHRQLVQAAYNKGMLDTLIAFFSTEE